MSNRQVVSRARHTSKRWLRPPNYGFAAADAVAPLVVLELPQAMLSLPIAFLPEDAGFSIVALVSLQPGKNLFVSSDGRWLGGYVPAAYRAYPFLLLASADGQELLCVDESSGLVVDAAVTQTGEPFFTVETPASVGGDKPLAQVAPVLSEVLGMLSHVAKNRVTTKSLCAVLQKYELIQAWPITLAVGGQEQRVEGLYRIDEERLGQLSASDLLAVRDAGGLALAYCQLLSMQHVASLGLLANTHAEAEKKAAAASAVPVKGKDLDLSFLEGSETLKFF